MTTTDEMVAKATEEAELVLPTLNRIAVLFMTHNSQVHGELLTGQSWAKSDNFRISKEMVAALCGIEDIDSISPLAWNIAATAVTERNKPWPLFISVVTTWTNSFLKIKAIGSDSAYMPVNVENPGIFSTLLNQQDVQPNTTKQKEETVDNQTQVMEHYFSLLEGVEMLQNKLNGASHQSDFITHHNLSHSIASLENEYKYLADVRNYRYTLLGKGLDELEQLMSRIGSDNKVAKFCIEKVIAKHKAAATLQVPVYAFGEYIKVSDECERITLQRDWSTQLDRSQLGYLNDRIHALTAAHPALPGMYLKLKTYRALGDIDFDATYREQKQLPLDQCQNMVLETERDRRLQARATSHTNLYSTKPVHVITPQSGDHMRDFMSVNKEAAALNELKGYNGKVITIGNFSKLMSKLYDTPACCLKVRSRADNSRMAFSVRISGNDFEFIMGNSNQVHVFLKSDAHFQWPASIATQDAVGQGHLVGIMSSVLANLKPRWNKMLTALVYLGVAPNAPLPISSLYTDCQLLQQSCISYGKRMLTTLGAPSLHQYSLITDISVEQLDGVRCADLTSLMVRAHTFSQVDASQPLKTVYVGGKEIKRSLTLVNGYPVTVTVTDTLCGLSEQQQVDYDAYMTALYQ